ncbi:MAG: hypothetical protein OXC07_04860 [Kistimonas sp.]|nr:hypothetical protein [Kistimonas sp.]
MQRPFIRDVHRLWMLGASGYPGGLSATGRTAVVLIVTIELIGELVWRGLLVRSG